MPAEPASYYPPRAGPASRGLALGGRWLRQAARRRKRPALAPGEVPPWRWLLVPGLLWRRLGKPELGTAILTAWAVSLTISIFVLSPELANAAALLASALHGLTAAAFLAEYFPHWPARQRLWRTPLLVCLWIMAFYGLGVRPAVELFTQRLTARGRTVMIQPAGGLFTPEWRRGDWVVYHLNTGAVNFDRILAQPEETIRFYPEGFEVNGRRYQRISPDMPSAGEEKLRPGQYFIWPTGGGLAHGEHLTETLLVVARVPENALIGKPWPWWFWRKQLPPPLKIWQAPAA